MEFTFIFPHQLFKQHPALKKGRRVILIEDALYFTQYPFHRQKIVLHRASMKFFEKYLQQQGYMVQYADCVTYPTLEAVVNTFVVPQPAGIHYCDTTDYLLERRLTRLAVNNKLTLTRYSTSNFICDTPFLSQYFDTRKRYFQTEFYIALRKKHSILLSEDQPKGGQWTYDALNRKKLPRSIQFPRIPVLPQNSFIEEAKNYVRKNFQNNPGTVDDFNYPVTFQDASHLFSTFLKERFSKYGTYQDAIDPSQSFLFHSILTPALNIGLLSPQEVISKALIEAEENNISLNDVEGFIRQVLGWREFIRAVYLREGTKQRTTNFFSHQRTVPKSFYTGTTGIDPVDNVIKRLLTTGYSNHIERLMILGNFMLLCEFHPDSVYQWFMELYIDAYDWVMVPNVYGMSQFADGGLMATKPYISGSNYILKMSSYKKGEWCTIWDALYWRFIDKHQKIFSKNPRMSMMVVQVNKMSSAKRNDLHMLAENFIHSLQ